MNDPVREALAGCAAGDLPANVALMRVLIESASPDEAGALILAALGEARDGAARERLAELSRLVDRHPDAWTTVRSVMAEADHAGGARGEGDPVAHWAGVFDRLAASAPDPGSALYALGSPDLLDRATTEVVARLAEWGCVGPDLSVLEIGCGSGRFVAALAPLTAGVTGLDVSAGMVERARRRCAGLANVRLLVGSGRDLAGAADASADLVLAADVFPYLVGVSDALAVGHVAEAARVLRPGGRLVVFNYSYRGDPARDARDFTEAAEHAGLRPERLGERGLDLWDALAFTARKPA